MEDQEAHSAVSVWYGTCHGGLISLFSTTNTPKYHSRTQALGKKKKERERENLVLLEGKKRTLCVYMHIYVCVRYDGGAHPTPATHTHRHNNDPPPPPKHTKLTGHRLLLDAVEAGHIPDQVLVCPEAFDAPRGQQVRLCDLCVFVCVGVLCFVYTPTTNFQKDHRQGHPFDPTTHPPNHTYTHTQPTNQPTK